MAVGQVLPHLHSLSSFSHFSLIEHDKLWHKVLPMVLEEINSRFWLVCLPESDVTGMWILLESGIKFEIFANVICANEGTFTTSFFSLGETSTF